MNKLIYCITSVNKDIFGGIKEIVVGIPNIFTTKFYKRHAIGLIALAAIIGIIVGCIGMIVLGVYVADSFFPGSRNAHLWIPIGFLWSALFIGIYGGALNEKCKGL